MRRNRRRRAVAASSVRSLLSFPSLACGRGCREAAGEGALNAKMTLSRLTLRARHPLPCRERGKKFAVRSTPALFNYQTANAPPLGLKRAPSMPSFSLFPPPAEMRGAERRKAHRIATLAKRGRALRSARSPRGAPLAALANAVRHLPSSGPRLRVPAIRPDRQRAPRTPAVVPAGRVPKPPGRRADEAHRAGAAQAFALANAPGLAT